MEKGENAGNQYFLFFSQRFQNASSQPFPGGQNLDASKLKEFVDDNFKFDEFWQKYHQKGRKHCGKRRNCS